METVHDDDQRDEENEAADDGDANNHTSRIVRRSRDALLGHCRRQV